MKGIARQFSSNSNYPLASKMFHYELKRGLKLQSYLITHISLLSTIRFHINHNNLNVYFVNAKVWRKSVDAFERNTGHNPKLSPFLCEQISMVVFNVLLRSSFCWVSVTKFYCKRFLAFLLDTLMTPFD